MSEQSNSMTAQQVFDQATAHLRTQGQKATTCGLCKYRLSMNGQLLKCAAGVLIRDDEYQPWMDGDGEDAETYFQNILADARCPQSMKDRLRPHYAMIRELQFIHDNRPVDSWEEELKELALAHNLTYMPPQGQ